MSSKEQLTLTLDGGSGVSFEGALGELVREAERKGIDLTLARDFDALGDGYWMVEISRVQPRDSSLDGLDG